MSGVRNKNVLIQSGAADYPFRFANAKRFTNSFTLPLSLSLSVSLSLSLSLSLSPALPPYLYLSISTSLYLRCTLPRIMVCGSLIQNKRRLDYTPVCHVFFDYIPVCPVLREDATYRVFIIYFVFFFEDFKIYSGLWPLSVSPRYHCVYTMAGQKPGLQQNWQSSENSQHFKEKHNS